MAPGSPSVRAPRCTSVTTPLNTAIAALVLSRTVTGAQAGAFFCGCAAGAGAAAPSTTNAASSAPSTVDSTVDGRRRSTPKP
jgi:hypothetical protein